MLHWIWNPVLEIIVGTWLSGKRRAKNGCAGCFHRTCDLENSFAYHTMQHSEGVTIDDSKFV